MITTALETPENAKALSERIERECEQMTLRINFGKFEKTRNSASTPGIVTDIYRCQVVDISRRAFIVLKHLKSRPMKFNCGDQYLADKVKLVINRLGEIVLISTSVTVLRVETEEPCSVESMELSQKQHTLRQQQEKAEVERAYFRSVTNQTNNLLHQDNAKF